MKLFGTDGIRARVGEGPLAPSNIRRIGAAISRLLRERPRIFQARLPQRIARRFRPVRSNILGKQRVLIGRDTRPSGPAIEEELIRGLCEAGARVLRAGVIPTPGVSCLTRHWGCLLGIVISASHNPAGDNGIKLISPEGLKVPDEAERAVEEVYADPDLASRTPLSPNNPSEKPKDASARVDEYVRWLAERVNNGLSLAGMKIVVDGAHGATSGLSTRLLRLAGAKVVALNEPPDGKRINRNCGATHPNALFKRVVREKADAGAAFDGDGDRAILVDEKGGVVDGDGILSIHALDLLARGELPGRTVVGTVMTNFGLEEAFAREGIRLVRTKVGDRYVLEEMIRRGATLGGEPSGHVIFLENAPTGDGMLSLFKTLAVMKRTGMKLSRLAARFRRAPQVLHNIPVASKPPLKNVTPLQKALRSAEKRLGNGGRIVLRYSGTEPVCRVMVEGSDGKQVDRIGRALMDAVKKSIGAANARRKKAKA